MDSQSSSKSLSLARMKMHRFLNWTFARLQRANQATLTQVINWTAVRMLPRLEWVWYGPRHLLLDVTERCNFACRFCMRGNPALFIPGKHHFPLDLYAGLLNAFPNVVSVELAGLGEPTMHPQLDKMVAMAKSRHMNTSTITNGTYLRKVGPRLIEAGLDHLCISLKALRPATFQSVTGMPPKVYDLVLDNTRFMVDEVKTRKSPMNIRLSLVVFKSQLRDISLATKLAKDLHVKQLELQSLIPSESGAFDLDEALLQEDTKTVAALAEFRAAYDGEPNLEILWPTLISRDPTKAKRTCRWYWKTLRVDVNGYVNACGRVYTPRESYGHALQTADVFNAPHFREWRRYFLNDSQELPDACKFCVESYT